MIGEEKICLTCTLPDCDDESKYCPLKRKKMDRQIEYTRRYQAKDPERWRKYFAERRNK